MLTIAIDFSKGFPAVVFCFLVCWAVVLLILDCQTCTGKLDSSTYKKTQGQKSLKDEPLDKTHSKTTCFVKFIMAEVEEEHLKSRWPSYDHNLPISYRLTMMFGTYFQRALVVMSIKLFLQQLSYMLIYIPLSNRQCFASCFYQNKTFTFVPHFFNFGNP